MIFFNYIWTEQAENSTERLVTALEIGYRLFNKGMKNWNKTAFHPSAAPAAQFPLETLSRAAEPQGFGSTFHPGCQKPGTDTKLRWNTLSAFSPFVLDF